ncbi:MAG: dihydrodipicolinate synthase family protein [Pirellulales bacterium]|nr:dihydrodipicolinate synthase family protein [Pirellulales bacterium]
MECSLAGVMAAMVTPLNEDETIDVEGVERLVERLIGSRISGIFVGGTMGEGIALRDSQRTALVSATVKAVDGRVPVLANASDTSTARVLENTCRMVEAGADVIVVTGRYGFPARMREETFRLVEAVARFSTRPVCFYENPSVGGVSHSVEEFGRFLELENVVALKYSAPDRDVFTRCVRAYEPRQPVLNGNVSDIAFAASVGASGVISGIASLAPGLCVRTFEAAGRKECELADKLQADLLSLYAIYGGKDWPLWPTAQKHALKHLGIIRGSTVTSPFVPLTSEQETAIERMIDESDGKVQ